MIKAKKCLRKKQRKFYDFFLLKNKMSRLEMMILRPTNIKESVDYYT